MKVVALGLIRFYKQAISPMLPPTCRFTPSCSTYAFQAIERFGVAQGTWMGFKRICRCNPFCPGGYDPVPERYDALTGPPETPSTSGAPGDTGEASANVEP